MGLPIIKLVVSNIKANLNPSKTLDQEQIQALALRLQMSK